MSQWQSADMAAAWLRAAEQRNCMMAAATERMFALAYTRDGARVLDAGTGTGDTALSWPIASDRLARSSRLTSRPRW